MITRRQAFAAVAALGALAPTAAIAHTGVGDAGGFAHGFWHPITGLDHVLAMVLVGMLAWQLAGRAFWLVPATFVLVGAARGHCSEFADVVALAEAPNRVLVREQPQVLGIAACHERQAEHVHAIGLEHPGEMVEGKRQGAGDVLHHVRMQDEVVVVVGQLGAVRDQIELAYLQMLLERGLQIDRVVTLGR